MAIAYPDLNDKSKEELFNNLENFEKNLLIFFIKLLNNSIYNGDKEDIIICEKFSRRN